MKICIYGAGAIGGYLGVQLARAGVDVSLVARGAHLAAMKANGLKLLIGDAEHVGGHGDAHLAHALDLGLQGPRVEHHAVADHRRRAAHDAARQQGQFVRLVADDQSVAGVMTALEPHHHVGAARQPIDDLALAFVAPLGADDGDVSHVCSLVAR